MLALDWFFTVFIHTSSLGDGLEAAPDGDVIAPKVEPISEEIKYRLFTLSIAEADVHICEGDGIIQLQSAGLDVDTCTLHLNEETLGLSFQLHTLTASGFVPDPQEPTLQQEVGLLDVNSIEGDIVLREPLECVPERQLSFLKKADLRTQRLWFLWREEPVTKLCGCCGECLFLDTFITRRPLVERQHSAVYFPHFSIHGSVPRHLGLQRVSQTLAGSSISEPECMWLVHAGLLEHYRQRYSGGEKRILSSSPDLDHRTSRMSVSDNISFVSARSSLTSLLDANPEHTESSEDIPPQQQKVRHKQKPGNLNFTESCDTGEHIEECFDYDGVVSNQLLNTVTLKIPEHPTKQPHTPQPKVHHRQSASDTSFIVEMEPIAASSGKYFHLPVPCLSNKSPGRVPTVSLKKVAYSTLERRTRTKFNQYDEQKQMRGELAKVSVSVRSYGGHSCLSPPLTDLVVR